MVKITKKVGKYAFSGYFFPPAVSVAPPCWVTLGRVLIFTALWVNFGSLDLLAQKKASPCFKPAISSGVR